MAVQHNQTATLRYFYGGLAFQAASEITQTTTQKGEKMQNLDTIFGTVKDIAQRNPKLAAIVCLFGIAISAVVTVNETSTK